MSLTSDAASGLTSSHVPHIDAHQNEIYRVCLAVEEPLLHNLNRKGNALSWIGVAQRLLTCVRRRCPGKVAASLAAPCRGGHVCGLLALGSDVNEWLRETASHRCIFYMIVATWADICGRKCSRLKRFIMRPRSNLLSPHPQPLRLDTQQRRC